MNINQTIQNETIADLKHTCKSITMSFDLLTTSQTFPRTRESAAPSTDLLGIMGPVESINLINGILGALSEDCCRIQYGPKRCVYLSPVMGSKHSRLGFLYPCDKHLALLYELDLATEYYTGKLL